MKRSNFSRWDGVTASFTTFLITISLLFFIPITSLTGQAMISVVNSLADDEKAHLYDNPATIDIDESMDGICGDELGRCTLRAALEEAFIIGQKAYVSFGTLTGTLVMDDTQGSFMPPDQSIIQGIQQRVIIYSNNFSSSGLFIVGNETAILGLGFQNGLIGILISGNDNLIGGTTSSSANFFHHFSQNGINIVGDGNTIQGNRIGITYDGSANGSPFGIFITGSGNLIGGTGQGEGNIISGTI